MTRRAFFPLLAALLLLAAAPRLDATAVLVFRSPERIVVASDSANIVRDATTGQDVGTKPDCKFRRGGSWWVASGGITEIRQLDVRAEFARAIAPAETIADVVTAMRRVWASGLRATVESFAAAQPYRDGQPIIAIFATGLDHGVPSVAIFGVDFLQRSPLVLSAYATVCPGSGCPDGRLFYLTSRTGASVRLLNTLPRPPWLAAQDASAARRVIQAEIDAAPGYVVPPIDVLMIDALGARWVGREAGSHCRF